MEDNDKELPGNIRRSKEFIVTFKTSITIKKVLFSRIMIQGFAFPRRIIIRKRRINLVNRARCKISAVAVSRLQTIFRINVITSDADRSPYFITPPRAYANNETFHNPSYNVLYERTMRKPPDNYKLEFPSSSYPPSPSRIGNRKTLSTKSKLQWKRFSIVSRFKRGSVVVVETIREIHR